MRCPNCGRDNPGIRLFCSRCGELLPESDAQAAERDAAVSRAEQPEADEDIKIYRRPGQKRELADEPEAAKAVPIDAPEKIPEHAEDADFFSRRERVRRLYEEDWPELSARQEAQKPRKTPPPLTEEPTDLFFEDGLGAEDVPARGRGTPEGTRRYRDAQGHAEDVSDSRERVPSGARRRADGDAGRAGRPSGVRGADVRRPPERESPYARPKSPSVRRPPELTRKNIADTGRVSTLVPRREENINPDNLFSVRGQTPLDEDDFDRAPKAPPRRARRHESAYEEPESQSFFMRHVRGIVGLILFSMTAVIVLTWAYTQNAQIVLARLDLAWSASAYAELGIEAYDAQDYSAAGLYFTRALARDRDNIDYAVYAANSYIALDNKGEAIEAVEACIALNPNDAEQYVALINLYGGLENMPEDAQKIVDEGYERTGDSRLK